jgi:hypothetical protein
MQKRTTIKRRVENADVKLTKEKEKKDNAPPSELEKIKHL